MRVAHRIHDLAVNRYGLEPADLIFDALTFPLSTGDDDLRRDAMATIEAIRRIKAELPGCLHHARPVQRVVRPQAGGPPRPQLGVPPRVRARPGSTRPSSTPRKIMPLNRIPEEQRDGLPRPHLRPPRHGRRAVRRRRRLRPAAEAARGLRRRAGRRRSRRRTAPTGRSSSGSAQRIIDGDRDGLDADLDEALAEGIAALDIINDILLAGMKVVGELFGSGEMQLPFVLQSAETMKTSVAYLEPHMEKVEGGGGKGRIVLATVKGDVHDIGKNLVDIILTNNGYEVHNLGIKVSIAEMIEKALEVKADAIGMSGLLVKSTLIMRDNLEELNSRELSRASRCCSAAPRSPAPTSSATCARSTRAASSTARTRSRACASWTASARSSATPAPTTPTGAACRPTRRVRAAGPLRLGRRRAAGRPARPLARGRGRQPDLRAAVHRHEDRQGHRARRHRGVHQRDRAVPQPVAVPPREGTARRPTTSSRTASGPMLREQLADGEGRRPAHPGRRLRLLAVQRRRPRPRHLEGRVARPRAHPLLVPARPQGARTSASPTSSGRSSHPRSTTPRSTS